MTTQEIEVYSKSTGAQIAKILAGKYSQADFDSDADILNEKIYNSTVGYATVYIFEEAGILSDDIRKDIKILISARYHTNDKSISKMTDEVLLAHLIKSEVIDTLQTHHNILIP